MSFFSVKPSLNFFIKMLTISFLNKNLEIRVNPNYRLHYISEPQNLALLTLGTVVFVAIECLAANNLIHCISSVLLVAHFNGEFQRGKIVIRLFINQSFAKKNKKNEHLDRKIFFIKRFYPT